jgi:hypothetical protein
MVHVVSRCGTHVCGRSVLGAVKEGVVFSRDARVSPRLGQAAVRGCGGEGVIISADATGLPHCREGDCNLQTFSGGFHGSRMTQADFVRTMMAWVNDDAGDSEAAPILYMSRGVRRR